jgi:hypothetical protein
MAPGRFSSLRTAMAVAVLATLQLAGCGALDDDDDSVVGTNSCDLLKGTNIGASSIGLPTTGAEVTSAERVAATGTGAGLVPEHCRVRGEIRPVDPSAPKILFQVNLPANWNNKAMMFGGGGYNGTIAAGVGNVPAGPTDRPTPLGRGYVTFGSDSGHQAGPTGSRDGSFGVNNEALRNFSGDALKKTRDVAIAIMRAWYGRLPDRTYFAGGSTGGREALLAVGNWPQDFDGAIALYPAWNATALNLHFGSMTQALALPNAYPSREQRKVLFDAAMQACDGLDNAVDGVISNQAACNASFNPLTATLNGVPIVCPPGQNAATCLTPEMIASYTVFERPTLLTYTLASGENNYPGFTAWGTDLGIAATGMNATQTAVQPTVLTLTWGVRPPANPMPTAVNPADAPPYGSTFWDQWVKYFVTRDPNANPLTLNPVSPGPWQARIVELNGIQDANRTDFSAFRGRGGKLLIAHGVHDGLVSNKATQQFMSRVRARMGAGTVNDFIRYYEIPGYNHATSSQFNAAWDSLTALEDWVERGAAPPNQVVADTTGVPGRSRPLCEFPSWPRYNGTGDVNVASSFTCVTQ